MKSYEPFAVAIPSDGVVLKMRRVHRLHLRLALRLLWASLIRRDVEIACMAPVDARKACFSALLTIRPLPYVSGNHVVTSDKRDGWQEV